MPRAARAYEADVLHVPYWAPPLRSSVPIVVTIHDIIPLVLKEYRGGPLVRAYTGLVSAATRGAALILTDSEASRADIVVNVDGGGFAGQAGAGRHGISRALLEFNGELRERLKSAGFLTRDPRMKERKKYGRPGARKRFQFSKR